LTRLMNNKFYNKPNNKGPQYRINDRIKARQVRLIDPAGVQLGVVSLEEALRKAVELSLDLIEIAPEAKPPVCKIGDFGKLRFEASKKEKGNKQHQQIIKTVQFSPNIGEADLLRKINEIQKFIDKGYKVNLQVVMKGRQQQHAKLAQDHTIEVVKQKLVNAEIQDLKRQDNKITACVIKIDEK
jgi:translation initiation factor IF-3